VAERQFGSGKVQQAAARRPKPQYPVWGEAEVRIVDRYARAVAQRRYSSVKAALPECRRELAHVTPGLQRTDLAILWVLLCRAYDYGLPRRKHTWTEQESRLLERRAAALARGECPDTTTAVGLVKRAFEQAGLEARHPDGAIRERILARALALGRAPCSVNFSPEEVRVIDRFSRALTRNEYAHGTAAVADCRRALARAGVGGRRSDDSIACRINAGARALGRISKFRVWSVPGVRIIDRFARAIVSGRYPSIAAATRDCRRALERAGQFGIRTEGGLRAKLRVQARAMGKPEFRSRWNDEELRILDGFARAIIRGTYPTIPAAAARCRRALERAGLRAHVRGYAIVSKLRSQVRVLSSSPA
jgi:hypothetical protein